MNIGRTMGRVLGRSPDDAQDADQGNEGGEDALALLKRQHEEVKAMFEEALSGGSPNRAIVAKICDALELHAQLEEKLFYPAMREATGRDGRDEVLEAYEEHASAKDLIKKIRNSKGRDETLKAKVTVLKEMIEHHVQEEENEMFPHAREALGEEELGELGARMERTIARGGRAGGRGGARKKATRGGAATARKKTAGRKTAGGRGAAKKSAGRKKTRR